MSILSPLNQLEGCYFDSHIKEILQFKSIEQAKSWLNSPEYNGPHSTRDQTTVSQMVVIEGV